VNTRGRLSIAFAIVVAALFGCKKPAPPPAAKAPEPSAATAPLDYLAAQGRAKQQAIKVTDIAQLTSAIQKFQAMEDRYPRDFNELVAGHYLGQVPAPPRGMQFAYNPQTGQVRVVPEGGVQQAPGAPAQPARGPGGIRMPVGTTLPPE
jgi:hypothetical protein